MKQPWMTSRVWILTYLTVVAGSVIPAADVCSSATCRNEAENLVRFLDPSVNPCDNFVRFLCGRYKPGDLEFDPQASVWASVEDSMTKGVFDFKPERFANELFQTCMSPRSLGKQAEDLMIHHINILLKSLVFKRDGSDATFDWIKFISEAKRLGYSTNFFLDFEPLPLDDQNSFLRFSIKMTPAYFDAYMNRQNASQRELYAQYVSNITRAIGDEMRGEKLKKVLDFEAKLAEMMQDELPYGIRYYSLEDLQQRWPSIDWRRLVNEFLMPLVDSNEKPTFKIWSDIVMSQLAKLLEDTPETVLSHYAVWKVQQYSVPFLTEEIREVQRVFFQQIGHKEEPRKIFCRDVVFQYAKYVIEHLYLSLHQGSVLAIKDMVKDIKIQMVKMIDESKMLTKEQKKEGADILESLPITFGSSLLSSDTEELEKFYVEAKVTKDNFLQTILDLEAFMTQKKFSRWIQKRFFQLPTKTSFFGVPTNHEDHLYIPIDMTSSEVFKIDRPMCQNFAVAGTYLARVMFLSVADLGGHWDESAAKFATNRVDYFETITSRFRGSFKNQVKEALAEDAIDLYVGLRTSYAAYQDYIRKSEEELQLQLPYSRGQLFWMSFLRPSCYLSTGAFPRGSYGPNNSTFFEFMITGAIANLRQASEDFQCPLGSELNPELRGSWW